MLFRALTTLAITSMSVAACSEPPLRPDDVASKSSCYQDFQNTIQVPAGLAIIGSDTTYPEEAPKREVVVKGFLIDATEVTNQQFRAFVNATGYVTDAEKIQAGFNTPGGAVFTEPTQANPSWWQFVEGANWKNPEGPDSSIEGRDFDPVVQISLKDAKTYADWKGHRLPSEEEWEYAARAGSDQLYVWGKEKAPEGEEQANTWQGAFPIENTLDDGFLRRAPVGCFPANDFGLYDMIGNVWEWTDTPFGTQNGAVQYVIKGGSFLCAPNYCRRYRAAALQPQDADFTTNHIGFRTVKDLPDTDQD